MKLLAHATCLAPLLLVLGCQSNVTSETTTTTTQTTSSTTSGPTTSPFSITIENTGAATAFVHAVPQWPFVLSRAGTTIALSTSCSCAACSGGTSCMSVDYLSTVVAIPAGESVTIDEDLSSYTELPVPAGTCPGANGFATCGQASAFATGAYELEVAYDGEQAMLDQSLHPSGNTQWGLDVWVSPYMFTAITLAQTATQTVTVGTGTTAAVVTIALP